MKKQYVLVQRLSSTGGTTEAKTLRQGGQDTQPNNSLLTLQGAENMCAWPVVFVVIIYIKLYTYTCMYMYNMLC